MQIYQLTIFVNAGTQWLFEFLFVHSFKYIQIAAESPKCYNSQKCVKSFLFNKKLKSLHT